MDPQPSHFSGTPNIALATATGVWQEDIDAEPLVTALEAAGASARPTVWHDPQVDWSEFDLVLVRSTWDYVARIDEFLRWADLVESVTTLANPAEVVRWSTNKTYLADLDRAGIAVAPTGFLHPGDFTGQRPESVRNALRNFSGEHDFVVKPTISAGSKDTARYRNSDIDEAVRHAIALLSGQRSVMVQPYLDAVDEQGETAVVLLDGEPSHAFTKGAILSVGAGMVEGLFAPEVITPREARPDELALADQIAIDLNDRFPRHAVRYARVDMIRNAEDQPVVLELELVEPSMFLWTDPGAPARVASAILRWANNV